jgi:hypothetical protein
LKLERPSPPYPFDLDDPESFKPAPEVWSWALEVFIHPKSKLYNPEHDHLIQANLGFLWAGVENARQGRRIIGQCEMPGNVKGGKWQKARQEDQLYQWFEMVPDFVITLDAAYCSQCSDAEFCALVEHELLHAGQARDEFGEPAFTKTGEPKFTMRGHDVEEFVSIVRRYGAVASHTEEMIAAGSQPPQIAPVHIAQACGTCKLRVA